MTDAFSFLQGRQQNFTQQTNHQHSTDVEMISWHTWQASYYRDKQHIHARRCQTTRSQRKSSSRKTQHIRLLLVYVPLTFSQSRVELQPPVIHYNFLRIHLQLYDDSRRGQLLLDTIAHLLQGGSANTNMEYHSQERKLRTRRQARQPARQKNMCSSLNDAWG